MKTYLIALFCLAAPALMAQVPNLVNYQGRVAVGTVNFDGTGQFKFALVNAAGTTSYWSNNGSSTAGSEPTAALTLPVSRGLYQVLLGDTGLAGMSAIPASVWANAEVRLRVWFNDGTNGFQLLTPDQRLAPSGYLPDGSVTEAKVSDGAVTGAKIAAGAVGSAQLGSNAVQSGNIASGAVGNAQLASNAVQSGNIAAGAVTNAALANGAVTGAQLATGSRSGTLWDGVVSYPGGSTVSAVFTFSPPLAIAPVLAQSPGGWTLTPDANPVTGFTASRTPGFSAQTVDAPGPVGIYTSLAVIGGNPAISYYGGTNNDLKFARNSAADGSGVWTTVIVDSTGIVGAFTSLAVIGGNPAISYFDATNFDLKFARNSAADGRGTWTTVTVDAAGAVGQHTSLAVIGGNPAISYYAATNYDLKFARNSAADGRGTWTTVTVDAAGNVGFGNSLAVIGCNPAISYYDATNHDLKFARNSAADGSGTWTTVTVDAAGVVGQHPSLAVIDGNPAISYNDSTNYDLKFASLPLLNWTASEFGTAGPITVTSFAGSGSGLTNLNGASLTAGSVPSAALADGSIVDADISGSAAISATKLGAGSVDNAELGHLNGVTSSVQTQMDAKAPLASPTFTGTVRAPTFSGALSGNAATATSATSFTGSLAGDVTGTQGATSITAATVTGKALTGFVSGAGTVSATDTILTAINKLNGNVAMRAPIASPTFTGTVTMPAGTNTVSPLRLQTGVNLTTPVFGSVEFDGTNLYLTNNSGTPTRKTLAFTDSAISGSGAGLTNLNASSMSSGTLPDARLSSNVVQLNSTQTLTNKTISGSFTGPLTGNVTGNVSGSAASFTGLLAGDVTGTQSATTIANGAVTSAKLGSNLTLSGTTNGTFSGDGFALANIRVASLILGVLPNLFASGFNSSGQLGDGTTTQRTSPVQVGTETNWQSVDAGAIHTLAVRSDGTLWAWGNNANGQLGDGSTTNRNSPVQIGTATNWRSVAAGGFHTLAVRSDGTLWTWGNNANGQLGDGSTTNRTSPVQVGTVTNWQSVSAGDSHTVALRSDGTLWAWGSNFDGELGDGSTTSRTVPVQVGTATNWQSVAGGGSHTVAVRSDGTLWAWGSNSSGKLGLGDTVDRLNPVQVGTATNWQTTSAGGNHTLALRSDGTLWAWGLNANGQLGLGNTTQRLTPTQVGTETNWQSVAAGASLSMAVREGMPSASVALLTGNNVFQGSVTASGFVGNLTGNVTGNATTATTATTATSATSATTATSATSFTGALAGDVTGTQGATSIAAATVTGKALTGFVSGAGTVSATDSILTAISKLNGNTALRAPIASPAFTGIVTVPSNGLVVGSTQLVVTGGDVGIGTSSPKGKLHVTGDYYGSGHLWLHAVQGDGSSGTAYVQARDDSTTSNIGLTLRTKTGNTLKDALAFTSAGDATFVGDVLLGGASSRLSLNGGHPSNTTFRVRVRSGDVLAALFETSSRIDLVKVQSDTTLPLSVSIGTAAKPGGGPWAAVSDRRLKKGIQPLTGTLERLMALRSVTFEYNNPASLGYVAGQQTGFIAQEVEEVFPDWVKTGHDGMKLLSITGFESLAVQALRELRAEKDAEMKAKDEKIADLEARLAKLEQMMLGDGAAKKALVSMKKEARP